jgi:pimeloyl-ACP methyl ester carboxylesterase
MTLPEEAGSSLCERDWFMEMLSRPVEVVRVVTGGTEVELVLRGAAGRPGIFFVHGAGAHGRWWDSIAPFFADEFRVAAITLPGHGNSAWRDRYSSADIWADISACLDASSFGSEHPPIFIGHSMGGAHLVHGALYAPEAMRALVMIDTSFRSPKATAGATRLYNSEAEALDRFRLMPPGPPHNPLLVRHVARHAIKSVEQGWSWKMDPSYWKKFEPGSEQGPFDNPLRFQVPAAHLIAGSSHVAAAMDTIPLDRSVLRIVLPRSGHHIMLDQPLTLVAALRTLIAVWTAAW